ncbi:MAG TPA: helix-turn-helix domain-containing protein [Caulobacterales bacterium]|nr:helix-turn-helix domain-containing protein [Caulobacterales bacterium]
MSAAQQTIPLRSAHRDLTQARILGAAIELLRGEELEAITVADVAAQAGVTERTIYRHFATREDLLTAMWPRLQMLTGSPGFPSTAMAATAQPTKLFPRFDEHAGAVRASIYSRAGREIRAAVNAERQAAVRACVRDAYPDLQEPAFTRVCAVVQLLNSAYAWAVMKDNWGLDGAEAGLASSEAIAELLGVAEHPAKKSKSRAEEKTS